VRLFLDIGMRLDVLAKLRVDDVNLDCDNLRRPWQGHGPRVCSFGTKTAQALDAISARDRARSDRTSHSSYWAARTRRRRPDHPRWPVRRERGRTTAAGGAVESVLLAVLVVVDAVVGVVVVGIVVEGTVVDAGGTVLGVVDGTCVGCGLPGREPAVVEGSAVVVVSSLDGVVAGGSPSSSSMIINHAPNATSPTISRANTAISACRPRSGAGHRGRHRLGPGRRVEHRRRRLGRLAPQRPHQRARLPCPAPRGRLELACPGARRRVCCSTAP